MKKVLKYDLLHMSWSNIPESAFDVTDILIGMAITTICVLIFLCAKHIDEELGTYVVLLYSCVAALLPSIFGGSDRE